MIDEANLVMIQGEQMAIERIQGVNDNMVKSHFHEYYEIYYLEEGKRYHMINDKIYYLNPGEFIVFPPYTMHHSYGDKNVGFKRVVIYFKPEYIIFPELLPLLSGETQIYRAEGRAEQEVRYIVDEILSMQRQKRTYHQEERQLLLTQLLIKMVRLTKKEQQVQRTSRMGEVIHYINQHYMENITLENLAAAFYISPYYLCREFKKHTYSTIIQYVNNVRIIHAQRMFLETDKNITDISREVGFSNITHFNRVFKSITGMSPSQSKKQHRR